MRFTVVYDQKYQHGDELALAQPFAPLLYGDERGDEIILRGAPARGNEAPQISH